MPNFRMHLSGSNAMLIKVLREDNTPSRLISDFIGITSTLTSPA